MQGRAVTEREQRLMREMRSQGYRARDIAEEFGLHRQTAARYTRGVRVPRSLYVGSHGSGTQPVDPQRGERFAKDAETMWLQAIADREGLSRERVRQIVAGYQRRTGQRIKGRASATPAAVALPIPTLAQRLLGLAVLARDTGCWRWQGATMASNDRMTHVAPRSTTAYRSGYSAIVPRATFQLWRGPLGREHIAPTVCGDWCCINPFHWERKVLDDND